MMKSVILVFYVHAKSLLLLLLLLGSLIVSDSVTTHEADQPCPEVSLIMSNSVQPYGL